MIEAYGGYEQGPIRPPSEAGSLLLRVTRNCPWNRCKFCPVYKGTEFSVRPTAHVRCDIDALYEEVQSLNGGGRQASSDPVARQAAANWLRNGRRSVFLQDADSLVIPPAEMLGILRHLTEKFPGIPRITSYARSATVARIGLADLKDIREAGLNRLHIGLESGSNEVLRRMHKGTTQKNQIAAGQKVKRAGMELSEYYMPGLGGRSLRSANAKETAAALNEINPDFIRLRSLAIPCSAPLYEEYQAGRFDRPSDIEMAREILLFLESLQGITSTVASDHILNLLPEVEGTLPQDQGRMIAVIERFLQMSPEEQCLYQVGRRTGVFGGLHDLQNPFHRRRAEEIVRKNDLTPANVDEVIAELMRRFV